MRIGNQDIGINHPPYIIAEIGVNHDGDVERALSLTDAAADAGADAIKLQFFETDRLMSKAAKLAAYQKYAGETDPIEMLRRLELTINEMAQVVKRAHGKNIHAIVTVFSKELVPIAETLPWDAYKSASPDIVNKPLLEGLMHTGKPMIVSTGASTMDEVKQAVGWLEPIRDQLTVLHCVSCYPTPPENAAFRGIQAIADEVKVPVGYSDHTKNTIPGAAVFCGAVMLEKHLTWNRKAFGPDHSASLEHDEFNRYCIASKTILEQIRKGTMEIYDERENHFISDAEFGLPSKYVQACEQDVRKVSRQSVVSTQDIPAGTTITRDMLTIKRPGTGILACDLEAVIGCTTAQPIEADVPINATDLVQFENSMARL